MQVHTPFSYRPDQTREATPRYVRHLYDLLGALGIDPAPSWSPSQFRSAAEHLPGEPDAAPVEVVKGYIETHADEALDLEQLAALVGLSKYYLARRFREAVGVTLWTYVQQARIRKAKALLAEGLPPTEVALAAGFYDQSHFNRVFKRFVGQTPGQYRRDRAARPPHARISR